MPGQYETSQSEETADKIRNLPLLKKFSKKTWIIVGAATLLVGLLASGLAVYRLSSKSSPVPTLSSEPSNQSANNPSKQSSNYYSFTSVCKGTGRKTLTTLPINLDVIRSIWPLGNTIGADVIAAEGHGFFYMNLKAPRDSFEVVAPANGVIASVNEHHILGANTDTSGKIYEVMIAHTCTEYSTIAALTSVDPAVIAGQPITEGKVIGKVGGNNGFSFGVLDTASPNHYVVPEHYDAYKLYGKNAFDYFSDNLKAALEAKSLRNASPKGGTLEFDRDGKLVGNWYKQGLGGFSNQQGQSQDYYKNFLAFGYDFIDPEHLRFSLGDYLGQPKQFGVKNNGSDPATVSVSSGVIKYELMISRYRDQTSGQMDEYSDRFDPIYVYRVVNIEPVVAVLLVQLTADRTLKLEIFPGKTGSQIGGFTNKAIIYER